MLRICCFSSFPASPTSRLEAPVTLKPVLPHPPPALFMSILVLASPDRWEPIRLSVSVRIASNSLSCSTPSGRVGRGARVRGRCKYCRVARRRVNAPT